MALKDQIGRLDHKAGHVELLRCLDTVHTDGAATGSTVQMRVAVQMGGGGAAAVAQGELELLRPVNSTVDDAFLFKGAQGAVQGDAVYRAECGFEVALGNRLPALQENGEHLLSDSG